MLAAAWLALALDLARVIPATRHRRSAKSDQGRSSIAGKTPRPAGWTSATGMAYMSLAL